MITIKHWPSDWNTPPDVCWSITDTVVGEMADYQALYFIGQAKPNYPMPALETGTNSLIAWLWVHMPRTKRNRKALTQWYLALCFDKRGHYTG